MGKMGRPTKEVVKDRVVGVRFDKSDYEKLNQYASDNNLTITQAIRKGVELLYSQTSDK